MSNELTVVAGGGGFIGGHLAKALTEAGKRVRVIDKKPLPHWWQIHAAAENLTLDLQNKDECFEALDGATTVFNLAADMGGIGFIESNKALCMLSVLINTHLLLAAKDIGVQRFFYASSACVYPMQRQKTHDVAALKESDAYPADPQDGYGWEKLFGERLCRHFREDFGLPTRVARFHNVYGPYATWCGPREKAPYAICRKVIEAKLSGNHEIEIWGDGKQTRSFMYIDDCISGIQRIVQSEVTEPINLGSEELVSIDQLVDIVEEIAGLKLKRNYKLDAPRGVAGRNSDNSLIKKHLDWAPEISLRTGLEKTYRWIYDQITTNAYCPPN